MNTQYDIDTQILLEELNRQGIEHEIVEEGMRLIKVTFDGQEPLVIQRSQSKHRSQIGQFIAKSKDVTSRLVEQVGVPIPSSVDASDSDNLALKLLNEFGVVVVKPDDGAHGNGVTTDVTNKDMLQSSLAAAREYSKKVLVQQQVAGEDVRLLVIGGQLAGGLMRHPATVNGDGEHTIRELIEIENARPERDLNYRTDLNMIAVDSVERYIEDMDNIPAADATVRVMGPANVGQGGTSEDITNSVDPKLISYAVDAAAACQLEIAGVDFMMLDPKSPISIDNQPYFIEVNALPLLGFHERPTSGDSQPVARILLEWLRLKQTGSSN